MAEFHSSLFCETIADKHMEITDTMVIEEFCFFVQIHKGFLRSVMGPWVIPATMGKIQRIVHKTIGIAGHHW